MAEQSKFLAVLKSTWFLILRRVSRKLVICVSIKCNGRRVIVPVIEGVMTNVEHSWILPLLKDLMPLASGTFCDIGCNIGQTLIVVKSIDNDRSYIGFDPNAKCIAYCDSLIAANKFRDCLVYAAAVSNKFDLVQLYLQHGDTDATGTLQAGFRPNSPVVSKSAISINLGQILQSETSRTLLGIVKIDVEGCELEVIQSLQLQLESMRPLILIEILPCYSAESTERISRQEKVQSILKGSNYSLYRVMADADAAGYALKFIEKIEIHGDLGMSDYLAIPIERESEILQALRFKEF